ncbi:MAG: dual specificity protein phosphatase family protein [Candidatus Sulfotelmatobacter sp.]
MTKFYWVNGPWNGKLALAGRPRGGDWLEDDVAEWKRAGIGTVLSLLAAEEEKEFDLQREGEQTRKASLEFLSLPIADMQVPRSEAKLARALEDLTRALSAGRNVLVHCRQGIGRSGLIAACLLIRSGMSPGAALDTVSAARGMVVPETAQQRDWIERYAPALTK